QSLLSSLASSTWLDCSDSSAWEPPVIKLDIINEVVNKTGITKTKAELAVETVFESMKRSLAKGDRIELRGFGVFNVRPRKTGIGRNPRMEFNFLHNLPVFSLNDDALRLFPVRWALAQPSRLLLGIPFASTLMLILPAHEMGHYLCCRYYGVYATLPFFIPAPTLIGTLGAFIRIRSPIRSRTALFDIGIAGPIAGFLVALAVLAFAMPHSKVITIPSASS